MRIRGTKNGPTKEGFLSWVVDFLTWCLIVCNISQLRFRTNLETSLYAPRAGQSDLAVANTKSSIVECSTTSLLPRFAIAQFFLGNAWQGMSCKGWFLDVSDVNGITDSERILASHLSTMANCIVTNEVLNQRASRKTDPAMVLLTAHADAMC